MMTLTILTDPIFDDIKHGFFTRAGGVSSGVFKGLNCGPGSSDQREAVATNRARVAEALGIIPSSLLSVYQVHSNDVITVTEPFTDAPKADAMVTDRHGIALGVLTADCAPILFADEDAGVIGAAHAGWKGALGGVIENTISAMEALGAERPSIVASVGPTISQRNYEVGPEFLENFIDDDPGHSRFFTHGEGDRYRFDLPSFVLNRLRTAGVADASWIGRCTYDEPQQFYSYRRTTHAGEVDYGRLISAIRL